MKYRPLSQTSRGGFLISSLILKKIDFEVRRGSKPPKSIGKQHKIVMKKMNLDDFFRFFQNHPNRTLRSSKRFGGVAGVRNIVFHHFTTFKTISKNIFEKFKSDCISCLI